MKVDFGMNFADSLATFHLDSTDRVFTGKPKDPKPHQIKALRDILAGFQTASRGQLIMPCGTGKTFTSQWAKERLQAQRTLVFVPSLALLAQIKNDWTSNAAQPFEALCVCSDYTVGRSNGDEPITRVDDLPFQVSNDVSEISTFLKKNDNNQRVIFSTYHSSPLIAEAQKNNKVPYFDLTVADEAHRCAGQADRVFSIVLDGDLIRSHRRLFQTATPRIYTSRLKRRAEDSGVEVLDMNDSESFGKPFYTLSRQSEFKETGLPPMKN